VLQISVVHASTHGLKTYGREMSIPPIQGGPIKTAPALNVRSFFDFPSNENKTDCYMSRSNQF